MGYIAAPVNVSPVLASLTKPLIVADFDVSSFENKGWTIMVKKTSINRQSFDIVTFTSCISCIVHFILTAKFMKRQIYDIISQRYFYNYKILKIIILLN